MPDLMRLLKLIEDMPAYRLIRYGLERGSSRTAVVLDSARPYLIAAIYESLKIPVLVITAQPENGKKLYEQLTSWSDSPQIKLFTETDALPYERLAADATTDIERVQVLTALAGHSSGNTAERPLLVVTSAPAIMGKIPDCSDFKAKIHNIELGMEVDPFRLLERWEAMGYQMENMAEVPGTISHRGGIIDIYPPTSDKPARLEFFGNTVDSLRYFDPATQRSVVELASLEVCPATELFKPLTMEPQALKKLLNKLHLSGCSNATKKTIQSDIDVARRAATSGNAVLRFPVQ